MTVPGPSALTENQADLGRARSARLKSGVLTSVGARVLTSLSPLLLVPITLGYLGTERYGLWMTVMSVTSMFLWADLGLGNTLMSRLTPLLAQQEMPEARELVSDTYRLLGRVAIVGLALLVLAYATLPWGQFFNASDSSSAAAVSVVCIGAFILNIPLSLIHRILFAQQHVSCSNLINLVGSLASLACGGVAVVAGAPALLVIAGVVAAPVVANAGATAYWFARTEWAALSRRRWMPSGSGLLGSGLRFLLIAVLTALSLNPDNLIVAHTQSVEDVATYSVVFRVFLALGLLVLVVNMPLWPANADALARGDRRWVISTTRKMMVLSGAATLAAGAVIVVFDDIIFAVLSDGKVEASLPLTLSLTAFYTLLAVASPLFMVQNAATVLTPQTIGWGVFLATSIPTKLLISEHLGFEWIPAVAVALYATTVLPSAWVGFVRATRAA